MMMMMKYNNNINNNNQPKLKQAIQFKLFTRTTAARIKLTRNLKPTTLNKQNN